MRGLWALALFAPVLAQVDTAAAQFSGPPPCSCDCCQTVPRMPSEQTASLEFKCSGAPPDQQTDICPASCSASTADVVLTAAEEGMEYNRYCQYKCKPATMTVGSECVRLDAMETQKTFEFDGNGDANSGILGAASNESTSWGNEMSTRAASQQEEQQSLEAAQSLKESIHYDVQAVIENRLRAETASAMARASAAEARAKADLAAADRAATEAAKADGVGRFGAAGQEASVEAAAAEEAARRSALEAERNLQQIEVVAKNTAQNAAKDAVAEIKKQAAAPAKELAETDAKLWGWDKPKFWPKVEAVRAADPYQASMTVAVQRMGEYEGYAQGELGKAKGDQAKAIGLASQANAMEAQGDKMGAETLRHEIDGLLGSAKGHEAKAQSDWAMAETMRKSVPQWQDAAMKAATFAAWKYSNVFTPPPPAFLQYRAR